VPYKRLLLTVGGAERADSTAVAIARLLDVGLIEGEEVVAFHDAARPLVPKEVIERTITAATKSGAAICGLPVSFSLRRLTENGSETVPRRLYWEVQTPQAIRGDILRAAWAKLRPNAHPDFTDEGSWIEAAGYRITLVAGHPHNLKITYLTDLALARVIARTQGRRQSF
jgi:2-C-methyl-D-erythritol 4-phosphate cytidylyltransferase